MRRVLTLALTAALAASLASPLTVRAQGAASATIPAASLAGRSVDPMGRAVGGEKVELLRGTEVVASVTTNGLGEWSFPRVDPGEYVVRMNVRGRIAGLRVTVAAGQVATGTMIVVPAATASLQLGTLANLLALLPSAAATTVQTVAAQVNVTKTVELNEQKLMAVLKALPEADRKAFAQAVVSAIEGKATGSATFAQYLKEFKAIVANPAVVPVFNPPVVVSG